MSKCEISSIDHIVMTVADMSKTIDFYCSFWEQQWLNLRANWRPDAKIAAFWQTENQSA